MRPTNPIPKFRNSKVEYVICDICQTQSKESLKGGHRVSDKYRCYKCYKSWERVKYANQIVSYRDTYYIENKAGIETKNKIYASSPKGVYNRMMKRSRKYNQDQSEVITFEYFTELAVKPCNYCNKPNHDMGVDRADNILGYTVVNSRPCCSSCNYLKRDILSEEQAKIFIQAINRFKETGSILPKVDIPLNFHTSIKSRNRKGWEYWYLTHNSNGEPRGNVHITEEEFMKFRYQDCLDRCSYCTGLLPTGSYCIDQIKPGKGYRIGNIRTACPICNDLKFSHLTDKEAEAGIHALQHHLREKQYCFWFKRKRPEYKQRTLNKWKERREASFVKIC